MDGVVVAGLTKTYKANALSPFAGINTFIIPRDGDQEGAGFGSVVVTADHAKMAGKLADGTPFSLQVGLTQEGSMLFYLPLYVAAGRVLNAPAAQLILTRDGSMTVNAYWLDLGPNNTVTNRDGNPAVTFSFNPRLGQFHGTVAGQDASAGPFKFEGVILQTLNSGLGYYLAKGGRGKVEFR